MNIRIEQIFRYKRESGSSKSETSQKYWDFYKLTKGIYKTGVGTGGKGIFNYAKLKEPGSDFYRIPAIILHSNPYKEDTEGTPWVDIINSDEGYAVYNGDNKSSRLNAFEAPGNKILIESLPLYSNSKQRLFAPPLLIFRQELIGGKRKGYRSFQGFGIPTKVFLRTQKEKTKDGHFTNLAFEITLFSLDRENESFSWDWIDKRRDPKLTSKETLNWAPDSWKQWVKTGNTVIEKLRRRVSKNKIIRESEQRELAKDESEILKQIYNFYTSNRKKHHFESLSSKVSCRIIEGKVTQGWITQPVSDEGIDFVNRLDLGDGFGKTSIVILGQAKCIKISSSISGYDLARVAARLQRGWVGVYVTTGTFSKQAQKELIEDKYSIVLINGKRLAQEVKLMINEENKPLQEILEDLSDWYEKNIQPLSPARVVDWELPRQI